MTVISVSLTSDLLDRLDQFVDESGYSRNNVCEAECSRRVVYDGGDKYR